MQSWPKVVIFFGALLLIMWAGWTWLGGRLSDDQESGPTANIGRSSGEVTAGAVSHDRDEARTIEVAAPDRAPAEETGSEEAFSANLQKSAAGASARTEPTSSDNDEVAPSSEGSGSARSAAKPSDATASPEPETRKRTKETARQDAGTSDDAADKEQDPTAPADVKIAATSPADAGTPRQADAVETSDAAAASADPAEVPYKGAPKFDIVRVDADGQTVIAGRTDPDTIVEVLLDDEVIGEARSDSTGAFVAVVYAELSGEARHLKLRVPIDESAADENELTEPETDTVLAETQPVSPQVDPAVSQTTQTGAPLSPVGVEPPLGSDAAVVPADSPNIEEQAAEPEQSVQPSLMISPTMPMDEKPATATSAGETIPRTVPEPQLASGAETQSPVSVPAISSRITPKRYRTSAPVIILPSAEPEAAPALVQPKEDQLALVQPAGSAVVEGVILDRVSYNASGDISLTGRGEPGRAVRIYGNSLIIGTTRVAQDGTWAMDVERDRGREIKLFRVDQITDGGKVASRIETPFTYSTLSPQVLRERKVIIQRGDMLWRIAEQYYGEGLRYSVIYGANSTLIRDPDLIYPGQVFTIPELVDAD